MGKLIKQDELAKVKKSKGELAGYDFTTVKGRGAFISECESSLYGAVNADGEDVIILLAQGDSMDVMTFQANGWTRVNYYEKHGHSEGESFKGRWV